MAEGHPRQETEKQRTYRRKQLRDWVEHKLNSKGSLSDFDSNVTDSDLRLADGTDAYMMRIRGVIAGSRIDTVKVNIYHTDDRMGPFTQYSSARSGEFTRSDLNPKDSGALSVENAAELGEIGSSVLFLGAFAAAASQLENQLEGVDGHPITAQEALELLESLKAARILG